MRLEQFEYLIEISHTNSISLASQNLHISQQALSKAIQSLEEELEIPIFLRTSKGVTLTKAGKYVLKYGKKLCADVNALKSDLMPFKTQSTKTMSGTLTLQYSGSFPVESIYLAIHQFCQAYPQVTISSNCVANPIIVKNVSQHLCDLGFISLTNDVEVNKNFVGDYASQTKVTPFAQEHFLLAVSHISPLAQQKSISLKKLLNYPIIILMHEGITDFREHWLTLLLKRYGEPKVVLQTNDYKCYQQAIANNVGFGIYTSRHAEIFNLTEDSHIVLLKFRDDIHLNHYCLTSNTRNLSVIAQTFLTYL